MKVYVEAASAAHERLNVLTEIMFLEALKQARVVDEEFERTGKLTGLRASCAPATVVAGIQTPDLQLRPFRDTVHGVPISLKDMLDVKGYDTSLGFTHKRNQPAAKDASLVSLIRQVRRSSA